MGYKIDYYKFLSLQLAMENLMNSMLEDLAVLENIERYLWGCNAIQSNSIDAINAYIMDKHIETALPAIKSAINNFYIVENAYFFEMYNIEWESGSIIEEDHLKNVEEELGRLKTEISTFIQNMNAEIKAVSYTANLKTKSETDFQDSVDTLITTAQRLREDFATYENSKLMEAKGIDWVTDASVTVVEECNSTADTMSSYVPEPTTELETPEYITRASTFYNVYQYTDERLDTVLYNKTEQTKIYYKYMESEKLSQYFNNMLYATVSMLLPFGNKMKGAKVAIHEGISLISFLYSADRTQKGYELMQQVELMDADSEANGLFDLENSKYGKYAIALGEACNLYTASSASNQLEYKVFGKPVTISSNIETCGEEYIASQTENLIYQVTGEQNIITSVISNMIGNGFVNGVKLEIDGVGRPGINVNPDYDVDIHNNSGIIEEMAEQGIESKLLGNNGEFKDISLENSYQAYVKRKVQKGQVPKNRMEWKTASDYWNKNSPVARGNRFNKSVRNAELYDYYEVNLENGKRLDSYDPDNGEIISRKATDLDKISEDTYRNYLSEFEKKYSRGTKIRSNAYPNLDGKELEGQYILEIPASNASLPNINHYKEIAAEYDVILRFTEE